MCVVVVVVVVVAAAAVVVVVVVVAVAVAWFRGGISIFKLRASKRTKKLVFIHVNQF